MAFNRGVRSRPWSIIELSQLTPEVPLASRWVRAGVKPAQKEHFQKGIKIVVWVFHFIGGTNKTRHLDNNSNSVFTFHSAKKMFINDNYL